jgi:pimeloyl-ACP methyl ester carboxylesterase
MTPNSARRTAMPVKLSLLYVTFSASLICLCPEPSYGQIYFTRTPPLVVFFGGANDSQHENMLRVRKYYQRQSDEGQTGFPQRTLYFAWDEDEEAKIAILNAALEDQNASIALVGHSWGGDTAMTVAKELEKVGLEVSLVVTLDAVSKKSFLGDIESPEAYWMNVYVDAAIGFKLAGHWGKQSHAHKNIFVEGVKHENASAMFQTVEGYLHSFRSTIPQQRGAERAENLATYRTEVERLIKEVKEKEARKQKQEQKPRYPSPGRRGRP